MAHELPRCHDEDCMVCQVDRVREEVCECGDWKSDHPDGRGRCWLCRSSRFPWDHCDGFRFSHWETHDERVKAK